MPIPKNGHARDKNLRNALADLLRHVRAISDKIRIVHLFYRRKSIQPVPSRPQRIEYILDPRANGFDVCLKELTASLSWYQPGEITKKDLGRLLETFNKFVNLLEPINRQPVIVELCNTVQSLVRYITSGKKNPEAMEHAERIEKERAKILRLLGEISSSFVDVTRECEKYQKELVKSSKEKTAKPAAKNAGKPAATATGGNAEEIKETIKEATKKITSVVADSGVKTIAAVKEIAGNVKEAKNETVAAVHKAKRAIIRDAHTEKQSETERRKPKGERWKQILEVMKIVREKRGKGEGYSLRNICKKVWKPIKGGYPNHGSLYDYCHAHEGEF